MWSVKTWKVKDQRRAMSYLVVHGREKWQRELIQSMKGRHGKVEVPSLEKILWGRIQPLSLCVHCEDVLAVP